MNAKYKGRCGKCGKEINVGEEISWSRQERGKVYHIACRATLTAPTIPPPISPALDAAAVMELLKKVMASGVAVSPISDEPEEAEYVPTVAEVARPIAKSKPIKLGDNAKWYDVLGEVLPFVNRILLIGPPSTGKSTTAMQLAETKHRITMTETTSREDLIGMFHLIDGATKWVDGPFTTAMRNGEAVLVDEIDRYSAECASLLYSLIDDRPHISLPTGELVEAQDGYKVVMTTNETIDTLPVAVQDRIEVLINANTPHHKAIEHVSKASQSVVMRYYSHIPEPSISLHPTVRRMRAFHSLLSNGIPAEVAGKLVFGNIGSREVLSAITSAEGN